jgi:sporulation protein YlmC with PRC-barrel domain
MLRLRIPGMVVAALLATALAVPAVFAQPTTPSPAPTPDTPTARGPAAPAAEAGQQQQAQEGRRSSQIAGTTVYNDRDERIGTVDDLIVGQDGRISEAVLSVGGFLGLGVKLVAVPYNQLRFEPRTADRTADGHALAGTPAVPDPRAEARWRTDPSAGAPVGPAPEAGGGPSTAPPVARPTARTRLVLPGATQDSLRSLPEFNYRD